MAIPDPAEVEDIDPVKVVRDDKHLIMAWALEVAILHLCPASETASKL
jgi:hypothetical protein